MHPLDVLFLGTCAHDYSPLLQTVYKDVFDKDARRSSCALLNGKYLIDCGEHCLTSLRIAKADAARITDIFVTHFHSDHFNAENVRKIAQASNKTLRVWVREGAPTLDIPHVKWQYMRQSATYAVENGVTVTGLPANHDANAFPQHLLLLINGKKIFYALDGAWLLNETYYALKNANLHCIVLDCTCGDYSGDYRIGEHNSIPMIRLMLPSLRKWGAIDERTKVLVSHLAPSLHAPHNETSELLSKEGVLVAYDGLTLRL